MVTPGAEARGGSETSRFFLSPPGGRAPGVVLKHQDDFSSSPGGRGPGVGIEYQHYHSPRGAGAPEVKQNRWVFLTVSVGMRMYSYAEWNI